MNDEAYAMKLLQQVEDSMNLATSQYNPKKKKFFDFIPQMCEMLPLSSFILK